MGRGEDEQACVALREVKASDSLRKLTFRADPVPKGSARTCGKRSQKRCRYPGEPLKTCIGRWARLTWHNAPMYPSSTLLDSSRLVEVRYRIAYRVPYLRRAAACFPRTLTTTGFLGGNRLINKKFGPRTPRSVEAVVPNEKRSFSNKRASTNRRNLPPLWRSAEPTNIPCAVQTTTVATSYGRYASSSAHEGTVGLSF